MLSKSRGERRHRCTRDTLRHYIEGACSKYSICPSRSLGIKISRHGSELGSNAIANNSELDFQAHADSIVQYFHFCKAGISISSRTDIADQLKELFKFFLEVLDIRARITRTNAEEVIARFKSYGD